MLSFEKSLMRSFIPILAITTIVIASILIYGHYQSINATTLSLIKEKNNSSTKAIKSLFSPLEDSLRFLSELEFFTNDRNKTHFIKTIAPFIKNYPQISSAMLADDSGSEYMYLRLKNKTIFRETINKNKSIITETILKTNQSNTYVKELGYNPLVRPWYKNALKQPGNVVWTGPYIFFTTKDLGITLSIAKTHTEQQYKVLALDFELSDISNFTSETVVAKNGKLFLLTDDLKVLGLPNYDQYKTTQGLQKSLLKPLYELDPIEIKGFYRAYKDRPDKKANIIEYESNGETWVGSLYPIKVGELRFKIGIIFPKGDISAHLEKQKILIYIILFFSLLFTIILLRKLSKTFSYPIQTLTGNIEKMEKFSFDQNETVQSNIWEIQKLQDAQKNSIKTIKSFIRYVPQDVVKDLVLNNEVAKISGENANLAILFSDIRGFTSYIEKSRPDEVMSFLSSYYSQFIPIINQNKGTVCQIIGDASMNLFGAFDQSTDYIKNSVNAGLNALKELQRQSNEYHEIGTSFGVDCGEVLLGNFGSNERMIFSAFGDVVNLSSRLESLTRYYGVNMIVSENVYKETKEHFDYRYLDKVAVKGKEISVDIYEPLGEKGKASESSLKFKKFYESCLSLYHSEEFSNCINEINSNEVYQDDPSLKNLLKRCEHFLKSPPPSNWDKVTNLDFK